MERKLNERLAMIADLEERGYSQDMIEAIVDCIEVSDKDKHSFSSLDALWEWLDKEEEE